MGSDRLIGTVSAVLRREEETVALTKLPEINLT
jgi:hypothetical protein